MTAAKFPIEAGHIMAFARSIGDFNPVYHDQAKAESTEVGGIVAPPTFVQASAQYDPDYPLRPQPGGAWFGSGRTASGRQPSTENGSAGEGSGGSNSGSGSSTSGPGTGLHADQHYTYHRPIRPGEVLTLTSHPGKTWEKQGRRGGALTFRETITEYRGEDGELVVTARGVGVRTGQTVKD
jgi:acyl dehydratase